MSAYICDPETFELLGDAALQFHVYCPGIGEIRTRDQRDRLVQALIDQNYRSVNFLYHENTPTPKYVGRRGLAVRAWNAETLHEVAQETRRWEYQSCETGDLYDSELGIFLRYMRDAIIDRLFAMCAAV